MKVLIVINGEGYRSGPQMSRTRGTGDYIRRQMLASKSHIKLVNMLKSQGHEVDVILNTYKLNEKDDNDLLYYYQRNSNVIQSYFYDHLFPSENHLYENIFHNVIPKQNDYDFVLFVRIDFYLKQLFFETLKFTEDKITFPFIDSSIDLNYANNTNHFFICHPIFIMPKKYFYTFYDNTFYDNISSIIYPHDFRNGLIDSGVPKDDILFMTNTLHVCCTSLGWNPYYIVVGRSYNNLYNTNCHCCSTVEHYYDTESHKFVYDLSKTTERWKDYLDTDTLEQNMAELKENSFDELQ